MGDRMNTINAFGMEIPALWDILLDKQLSSYIQSTLCRIVESFGVQHRDANHFVQKTLGISVKYKKAYPDDNYHPTEDYEQDLARLLSTALELTEKVDTSLKKLSMFSAAERKIGGSLSERADLIIEQINPFLNGKNVLDYGCGDGLIGLRLHRNGYSVVNLDVRMVTRLSDMALYDGIPFILYGDGHNLPESIGKFDNVLLLTVLHHTDNPVRNLENAIKATRKGGRLIVIESVYGVTPEDKEPQPHEKEYLSLSPEQQRKVNIFFDHFYNRIIHYSDDVLKKVNVPYNFNTPAAWKDIFERHGLKQEQLVHLGIDQPTVPEYHTLHILRKP